NAAKVLAPQKVETPLTMMGKKSEIWYEPLGVAFVIAPWNYPFFQAIVPIVAALAAGNAVVYKPSEHTPLAGLIESLMEEAPSPRTGCRWSTATVPWARMSSTSTPTSSCSPARARPAGR